jgi:predicted HTH transcriptional regulator
MPIDRNPEYLTSLLHELSQYPKETEWIEFKENKADPQEIGEYISALSNSAALVGKAHAYLIWGIRDESHDVVGTDFDPDDIKIGNEQFENWLLRNLAPKIDFRFDIVSVNSHQVVILEIDRTIRNPVQFQGTEYIRIGSYKKKLKDFSEKERALWRIFDAVPFESNTAEEHLTSSEVLQSLDYPSYFSLMKRDLPENSRAIISALEDDNLINSNAAGKWDITNLGAILFAKRLDSFGPLRRKAVRVIQYKGTNRVDTVKEQQGTRGYGSSFDNMIGYVNGLLPSNEVIQQALRHDVLMYPELAVRELIANALIHQDFSQTGTGPMIEIFEDRIEFTNPGEPLVRTERFVDCPPRSRNEALASLMRRIGVCEERGSGWDKVVFQTEIHQLPAPLTEVIDGNTRVTLFAHKPLSKMDKEDRVRAVYLHACLRYVSRQPMTNTSIRERFKIEPHNTASASRLIRDALDVGVVIPYDSTAAPKLMRYLPFWAGKNT